MLHEHFGDSAPFAILLLGPAAALDRQGPRLVATLRRDDPRLTTVSPWDRGAGLERLRPNPRTALLLVDFHVSADVAMRTTVPRLEGIVERSTGPPVRARTAGYATVARAIQEASVEITRKGELILAPILLVVLLLIFRSPVAAAIPLVFGAMTVIGARGLVSLIAGSVDISGFALSIATMIGLALGVDYALLIVSRFREELARGADPVEAATLTRMTAGRTTVFAGAILLTAVLVAVCIVPGILLVSLCATVAPAIVLAVAGPWIAGPAILVLLGRNIDRWRIGDAGPTRTRWLRISRTALRSPVAACLAIGLALVLIASPAASLATGPVTIEQLPHDDPARLDVEAVEAAVGGGWIAPSVVVAVNQDAPITSGRQLAQLDHWQAAVAHQPEVEAVIGPGPLVKRLAPLRRASRRFFGDGKGRSGADKVAANLDRAGGALARLRRGLGLASEGARTLALGSDRAQEGAGLLAAGLSLATGGGAKARGALQRFRHGAHRLASAQRSLSLGVSVLAFSIDELDSEVGQLRPRARRLERKLAGAGSPVDAAAAAQTLEKLQLAWRELGSTSVGSGEPHFEAMAGALREALFAASGEDPVSATPYAPEYGGLPAALGSLEAALRDGSREAGQLDSQLASVEQSIGLLRRLAGRLQDAVGRLRDGSERLATGSDRIASGADRLSTGLGRLAGGARRLNVGLARLRDGNSRLGRGLSVAYRRTQPLVSGAQRAEVKVSSARHRLRRSSPGLFDSGYFVLSALDGAPPSRRELASQAINLSGGGQAAQILVVDAQNSPDDPAVAAANERLRASARRLAARSGMEVAVTGGVAQGSDYLRATGSRLAPLVVAITLITFLIMLMILRALPLAALAIGLNLFAVAAAFGVLELLTLLPEGWPFGGTHHIDPVSAAGIFGVVFGLSIDYAVFLLMRMREGWERFADNEKAIAHGLERTASVITGAATIMAIVFTVLATAPIQSVAQFGISLTVAVMLDATVIRLMLVPALMKLAGPRIWWLPAPLERALPRLNLHGESAVP